MLFRSFFTVVPAMFGDQTQGLGRRVLSCRIAVLGGAISYGFYLFHQAIMHKVQQRLDLAPFSGGFVRVYVLTAAVTIVFSIGAYLAVERPVLGLKDRPISSLWRRRRESDVNAPPARP